MFKVTSTIKDTVRHTVRLGVKNIDFEIPLVESDTGPQIEFNIVDYNGDPVILEGKTVGFLFKRASDFASVNAGASGCAIPDPESNKAVYTFTGNDLLKPGTYFGDLFVGASGLIETAADAIRFIVRPSNK